MPLWRLNGSVQQCGLSYALVMVNLDQQGKREQAARKISLSLLTISVVLEVFGAVLFSLAIQLEDQVLDRQVVGVFSWYFFFIGIVDFVIATIASGFLLKRFPLLETVKRSFQGSLIILVINLLIFVPILPDGIKVINEMRDTQKQEVLDVRYKEDQEQQRATILIEEDQARTFAVEALSYLADRKTDQFILVLSQNTVSETDSSELKDVVANLWMPYFSNLGREKVAELINNNTAITIGFAGTNGNITQLEIGVSGGTQDSTLTVVHLEKEAERYTVRMILLTSNDDSDDPAMVDRYFRNLR